MSSVRPQGAGETVATGTVDGLLAQTGRQRFEDAFVDLAFPEAAPTHMESA